MKKFKMKKLKMKQDFIMIKKISYKLKLISLKMKFKLNRFKQKD